jgi:hypothetical protein
VKLRLQITSWAQIVVGVFFILVGVSDMNEPNTAWSCIVIGALMFVLPEVAISYVKKFELEKRVSEIDELRAQIAALQAK